MTLDEFNEILKELHVDAEDSGKKFKNIEDARKTPPVYGIVRAAETFNWFFDKKNQKVFNKGEEFVMIPSLYVQLQHDKESGKRILEPSGKDFKDYYNPYNGEDLNGKTILLWRAGGIGDILFIQPSIRYLKMKYPSCKVKFACAPVYFSFLNNWGDIIDELHAVPFSLKEIEESDYHATFEGIIERCEDAEKINAYKLFSAKLGLDLPESILRPILKTNTSSNKKVEKFLKSNDIADEDYICFQMRASSAIRTPPLDVWQRILVPLLREGKKIVVTDRPSISKQIDNFIKAIIPKELRCNMFSFCDLSESISDSVSLAKYSKVVLCPDSSMAHIGPAVGTPTFGIYAPFDARLRMSTYKKCDWIQPEGKDDNVCKFGGSKCFMHGHNPCPFNVNNASPCFYRIDCFEAVRKIKSLMKRY